MAKRAFDLLGAAIGLLLLAPLLLLLALLIKRDSPGPVFFRQRRVGRGGQTFRIHKLRTMAADAGGPPLTVGDDPRITRVGRWLRRSRLDELVQLIDVLRGDMSLVGPRPEVPEFVALYPADLRERVLAVRPGIVDPASLAFRDEAALLAASADPQRTYAEQLLPEKLRLSADYIDRATLWSDLRLILRTIATLVAGTPAASPPPARR